MSLPRPGWRALLAAGLLGALVAAGTAGYAVWALAPASGEATERAFEVPRGAGLGAIAARLEEAGLVRRAWAFEALARWRGVAADLRAGEYALDPSQGAAGILDALAAGRVRTHPVVLPEGITAEEVAARLEAQGLASAEAFLAVARDPAGPPALGVEGDTLEGYLFPETYRFAEGIAPEAALRTLVDRYRRFWGPAQRAKADSA
ncbi:MAG: endolytic transglycosylase MltG, partial [Myxococcota bacterium]|nr:endolytic transglycosylase MltG [Myxococcota bacterium]